MFKFESKSPEKDIDKGWAFKESRYLSIAREMRKLDEEAGRPKKPSDWDPLEDSEFISIAKEMKKLDEAEKAGSKEVKGGWTEDLKQSMAAYGGVAKKWARVGVLMAATFVGPSFATERRSPPPKEGTKVEMVAPTPAERISMKERTAESAKKSPWLEGWRARQVVVEKTKDGKWHFNPLKLLVPFQVEHAGEEKVSRSFDFNIPYEYAGHFDTVNALRADDHKKVAAYVDNQLKQQLEDRVGSFNLSLRTAEEAGKRPFEIKSLGVTGAASPEGPRQEGAKTIEASNVSKKNLELARKRAEKALGITQKEFAELGISKKQFDRIFSSINAEELQLSGKQFAELGVLAGKWPGATVLEKIFNLVCDYNDGKIKDAGVLKGLDKTFGEMRHVEVRGAVEAKKKNVTALPIPLFLLALIPFFRRRSRGEPEGGGTRPIFPEPGPAGSPIEEVLLEKTPKVPGTAAGEGIVPPPEAVPEQVAEKIKVDVPQLFRTVEMPKEGSSEWKDKTDRVWADDLWLFIDNPETVKRGLDYRRILNEMVDVYDKFDSADERELYFASMLTEAWKKHDIAARREAGVAEDSLAAGLDYENQPEQIKWARLHTRVLLEIAREKVSATRAGEDVGYLDLMALRVRRVQYDRFKEMAGA